MIGGYDEGGVHIHQGCHIRKKVTWEKPRSFFGKLEQAYIHE